MHGQLVGSAVQEVERVEFVDERPEFDDLGDLLVGPDNHLVADAEHGRLHGPLAGLGVDGWVVGNDGADLHEHLEGGVGGEEPELQVLRTSP